jgi:pimeloyl-ACP methyl ester carboxylesterase
MSGAWNISGTLYPATNNNPTRAIILLPELGGTRDNYPKSVITRLHEDIPNALILAIDMRGNGKSTNLGTWSGFDSDAFMEMKTDVLSARKYIIPNYPTVKEYYVVGASMGSTAALLAGAQENTITRIVMISPGMEYKNVDIRGSLPDYVHDLLVVASTGDSYSVQSANTIRSSTSDVQTSIMIDDGSAHGTALFDDTKNAGEPLSDLIVKFLK